jgi:ubiquinone/menaquinone biosynthesis C-methylase UbiE
LPVGQEPIRIIELCCGEGLLAQAILEAKPNARLTGFDGSMEMLDRASRRLAPFKERFRPVLFDLAEKDWRALQEPVDVVVTSLAIHHLDGAAKADLFEDICRMLLPDGAFLIADMVDPVHQQSKALAAVAYDQIVRQRSLELDGDTKAFDFFQREGWNIFHYLDPEDIDKPSPLFDQLKWLAAAGFRKIDVFWMSAGHAIFGGWKPAE